MMKNRWSLLLLVALLCLPVGLASAAQCATDARVCQPDSNGRCTAKFDFGHSQLRFDATVTGSCTVNVTACLVPKNQLNLQCEDVEANQTNSQSNPPANRIIQTEGQVCVSTGNKVPVYDITHGPGCSEEEIFIFCQPPSLIGISPRICEATELQNARRGSELATCGVNGFWPTGVDPISRKPGGRSDFWWCNEVPDISRTAFFGGYRFEPLTEINIGSTFPIQFILLDEFGSVVKDANALLSIERAPCREGFCPVLDLQDSGSSEGEDKPLYGFDGNKYGFTWQTKGLLPGVYNITTTFLNVFTPQQTITVVLVD
jgi:hypothetical protein